MATYDEQYKVDKIKEGIKKERKPNRWQLFLKDCIPQQKKKSSMPEKVSACGIEYNLLKENNPKELDDIVTRVQNHQSNKQNQKPNIKNIKI